MKRLLMLSLFVIALSAATAVGSRAEGLHVSPVTLEVPAPGATAVVTLKNTGETTITVQARVFEWSQDNGTERHEPTRKVVPSPPMTQLAPGATQTVRIVRTTKNRVVGEEAYRVFINEIPNLSENRAGTVSFVTRLRLPLFFVAPGSSVADVKWSVVRRQGATYLIGQNAGAGHLRVADLRLTRDGQTVFSRAGLAGYVLGRSTMQWRIPTRAYGALSLGATTNLGQYHAPVAAR
ncbi:molecular chaperone [Actibacterium sp. MT2.3-13A]|uniref:fimbrial biogenesis chaperone n=1 Tax=Actibacterium sp. MT2.3-13A TaxID=2828332 RepID=UPI001BA71E26|nr:molecular chaperone [Actibacterium sp. MT2.3-13A]